MKRWYKRIISITLVCIVGIAVTLLSAYYFRYISQRMYEDSTNHLVEIYGQVNNSFSSFMGKNWGILDSWRDYIEMTADTDRDSLLGFIEEQQEYWNFSEFYFLDKDGNAMTPDGDEESMSFEDNLDKLMKEQESVIANEILSTGQAVTVFAVPVEAGTYQGFDYEAIAISYTNADMVRSLDVDAFSGQSKCFVIYADGTVLLSTQSGGSVFSNYFSYLRAASDLNEQSLEKLRQNWENGVSGVFRCQIGGVSHYLSYQPVGYQNFILLGLVPESVASISLQQIQKATVDVLIKVFLLIGALIIVFLIYRNSQTNRKNMLELRYREWLFGTLSNSVEDIFVMLDGATWKVDYISPNVERLLGVPLKDAMQNVRLLGESAMDESGFITKEKLASIPIHESSHWEREHMHRRTGERRWYRETVYHESIEDMEKYLVVMSDRTKERQMNRNLQEALDAAESANAAKSHFLSNMSHDIRTPMNAIIGFTTLLARDADSPDKVREYTRKISASSQHLLSLINDVLDMSKIESGKTTLNVAQFGLPQMLEEIYTIMRPQAKAKNQSFEFHVQGHPVENLMGDKLRINQILINLLSNAVKYTPDNGRIDFWIKELPQTMPQHVRLSFIVQDNGIGMSEEFQKTVFDPFTREISSTTNTIQGTGLGMAITKNLIQLMGGVIHVESRLGEGTTFTVELSFALPALTEGTEFWHQQGIERILVVDDEEDICLDIQETMRDNGVEVIYATKGSEAIEAAAHAKAGGKDFQVILLDWKMPGLSGAEMIRSMREAVGAEVPIFVLSAYDWSDIHDEAQEAGADAFLPKPFFVSTFRQTLSGLFADRRKDADTNSEETESVLEGLLFLVAEDIDLNAEILSEMLSIEGARCEIAQNGKEALDIFRDSEPGYYDMILMDVQMPVMNGYEATRQIRACGHPDAERIPIVAMTANAFAEDVKDALDAGMNGHLAKPIDMDAVKVLLGRLKGGINT